ncbi:MAG: BrnT family toxin [Legionellales bacterium]|nr:BrnT family toxin [Legionellales bacterium]
MQSRFKDHIKLTDLTWDNEKNILNIKKHGLYFEDSVYVLNSDTVTFIDDRVNYGEERYITLGKLEERLVVLIHTNRDEFIRIISMRKANEREQKIYYERLEKTG